LYGSARVLFNRVTVQLSCPVVVFVAGATERGGAVWRTGLIWPMASGLLQSELVNNKQHLASAKSLFKCLHRSFIMNYFPNVPAPMLYYVIKWCH